MATQQPDYPPTVHLGTRRPVTPDAARRRRAVVRAPGSTTITTVHQAPPVPRADAPPPPPASLALPPASYPWLTPPPLFTSTSTNPDHHGGAHPPVLPFPYPPLPPPPPAPSAVTGGPSLSLSAGSTLANNNSSAASLTLPALTDLGGSTPLHPLAPRGPRSTSTPAVIPLVSRPKTPGGIPPPVPTKDAHWVAPAPDIARYHSAPTVPRVATGSPDRRLVPARDHVRIMRTGTPPLPRPTLPSPRHDDEDDDEGDDDDADVSAMPAISSSFPTRSAADERARLMHPGSVPPSSIPPAAETPAPSPGYGDFRTGTRHDGQCRRRHVGPLGADLRHVDRCGPGRARLRPARARRLPMDVPRPRLPRTLCGRVRPVHVAHVPARAAHLGPRPTAHVPARPRLVSVRRTPEFQEIVDGVWRDGRDLR
ncbi:hypothetical protein AMAG_12998 [Allomyces macrogynus ATCC 38327]|uniref:Uncharacterized protein n=1 Tax=Allomyces macrogynus (strain ATCC 38327) TaxID=578462 RepID=A0A0L0T0Q4_ALLM3|nr:hypothetical protein AMAG_12998 [Allomyces macrogynus ATCC 38327]|eukprot:KNE68341.1 hypothetical protein AMAG_12998 [Allomyces macrogynus ATCC 38327]